jgi:hypothetical protein
MTQTENYIVLLVVIIIIIALFLNYNKKEHSMIPNACYMEDCENGRTECCNYD